MDINRILSIIQTEFSLDNLKLQEQLEKTINSSTLTIDEKMKTIKGILGQLVLNELSTNKFQSLVQPTANNQTGN